MRKPALAIGRRAKLLYCCCAATLAVSGGCRVDVGGTTTTPGYPYDSDIEYFAPGPEFILSREAAAMKAYEAEQQLSNNIPINVLVGLETLKSGFGWSDEQMYENFCFNLQVRYALGYDRLGDGDFAIRTLYWSRSCTNVPNAKTVYKKAMVATRSRYFFSSLWPSIQVTSAYILLSRL